MNEDFFARAIAIFGIVAAVLLGAILMHSTIARGQEHNHPPQDAAIHAQFYQHWLRPDIRGEQGDRLNSCCSLQDCYPTATKNMGGTWFFLLRETKEWFPIPEEKLEHNTADPYDSPDGQSHVCATAYGFVLCAVLGSGA